MWNRRAADDHTECRCAVAGGGGMRRLPWVWVLFSVVLLVLLVAALIGQPVILRWDLGRRAGALSVAETAGAINQIRSAILQTVGTVVVLAGAYVAWRQ